MLTSGDILDLKKNRTIEHDGNVSLNELQAVATTLKLSAHDVFVSVGDYEKLRITVPKF